MMPYERLHAWKACDDLTVAVYKATDAFPRHELYGLTSQARRAAFSSAANIAEGSAKRGPREFRRYLDISIGSLSEVAYALHVAKRLEYLSFDRRYCSSTARPPQLFLDRPSSFRDVSRGRDTDPDQTV